MTEVEARDCRPVQDGNRGDEAGGSRGLNALAALLILIAVSSQATRGETVFLRGGEKLIGRVVAEEGSRIIFESRALGRLPIEREWIERMERHESDETGPGTTTTISASPAATGAPGSPFVPWLTPNPAEQAFDWIQIASGEWLKGRLRSLQEDKLEFDSEELDLLSFDWDKVRTLYVPHPNSIRFEGDRPVDGFVTVTTNEVRVVTGATTNTYPRGALIAVTPTGDRERDRWTGRLSAGVSLRAGNTRELDLSASGNLQRRTPQTRLELDYLGNYRTTDDVQTEQNHRAMGRFDAFLSRRLYVRVPDVEYYRDPLQNLEHRLTLGAGVGYDVVKTSRTEWNLTLGPAWQHNVFQSVPEGESRIADAVALVLATRFEMELTRLLDLIAQYRAQITQSENGDNTHHAVVGLDFEIHKQLKIQLNFIWDRIGNPRTESAGDTPSPDDFRLVTSFGFDF